MRFLIKYPYFGSLISFAYKEILSILYCSFIKLSNAFVFPDPEPPTIKILYGLSGIYGNFLLCSLCIIKTNLAFRGHAISYKVQIIERKYSIVQLEASKSSIKDLFSDLSNETNGFKYQITVKVLLKKYNPNGEI